MVVVEYKYRIVVVYLSESKLHNTTQACRK